MKICLYEQYALIHLMLVLLKLFLERIDLLILSQPA